MVKGDESARDRRRDGGGRLARTCLQNAGVHDATTHVARKRFSRRVRAADQSSGPSAHLSCCPFGSSTDFCVPTYSFRSMEIQAFAP